MSQPQHVPRVGDDGEAVVRKKTATATITNRPNVNQCGVRREINFGGVVPDEHNWVLGHRLASELSVGVLEVVHGGGRGVTESVESAKVVPVEDGVKGPLRRSGNLGRRGDQPLGASSIAEVNGAKVFEAQSAQVGVSMIPSELT